MFKRIKKNIKGQNTAEYALLIALVVAAIIAMQTYAQRALQGRIRDAAAVYMMNETNGLGGSTAQYEPYYLESSYQVSRTGSTTRRMGNTIDSVGMAEDSNRARGVGGFQRSNYNSAVSGLANGI